MLFNEIVSLSAEHLLLVAIAVMAATAIAAPSAVFLTHHARSRRWTLAVVNIIQTIPSLALFGFILPLPFIGGVGKRTAILALILYALLRHRARIRGRDGYDRWPDPSRRGIASGLADDPGRCSNRDGDNNRDSHDCRRDRRRRPGDFRLPRHRDGRYENNSGWCRASRPDGDYSRRGS